MLDSIWQDVKWRFQHGNMITQLIIANVAVFVVLNLLKVILFYGNGGVTPAIFTTIIEWLAVSSDWKEVLFHPWTPITSMFLHLGFWHILWNMLYLFWFGRITGDFLGNQRILPLYLLGGLAGALAFFVSYNLLSYGGPAAGIAYGASAAVMAIVVAAGVTSPDYTFNLLFLGQVKLKWIVAVIVFLDIIATAGFDNTGGHFAHLGGAVFGWFFVAQLRNGNDLARPVNNVLEKIGGFFGGLTEKRRPKPKVIYKNPKADQRTRTSPKRKSGGAAPTDSDHQRKVDAILEKIKQQGYDGLTAEEKEYLYNASKK